ncbi:YgfZ/GcvT domain-containing protein [Methylogaea oryzae]|uniref:tRNA-modifying protein YgfZ n=1 Tax=Methylogaea oryzae TaxID=1295382 RepID=A0A8D4VP56_9GAMM|nr:tRNA-modifying protein YgfZ [Methylogaea oryzae]
MNETASLTYFSLNNLAAIAVQGEDAATFLQGQTTCDVRQVTPQQSRPGALCNLKGRVIATIRLVHSGDGFLLLLQRDMQETLLKRLRMYVLRAKVVVADAGSDWRIAGLIGDTLPGTLSNAGLPLADETDAAAGNGGAIAVRLPGERPRCLLLSRQDSPQPWLDNLTVGDEGVWRQADIACGIPHIGARLSEEFIPQMLNLDLIGAVSFQKGCYTGQEIVARTHYLGQAKRRAYRYAAPSQAATGDSLFADGQADAVGTVIDAAGGELLAVVSCEHSAMLLRLGAPDGPTLQALPPPYGM